MNMLVPTYNVTPPLRRLGETNNSQESSYVRAVVTILGLLARVVGLLLLLGLLAVTCLVWLWLASFRGGWRLGTWLTAQPPGDQHKLSLNVVYGAIVALFSPLAVFGDWSQKLISERFQIQFPPKIDLRQIVEKQLGVELPKNSPCFPDSQTESKVDPALLSGSK